MARRTPAGVSPPLAAGRVSESGGADGWRAGVLCLGKCTAFCALRTARHGTAMAGLGRANSRGRASGRARRAGQSLLGGARFGFAARTAPRRGSYDPLAAHRSWIGYGTVDGSECASVGGRRGEGGSGGYSMSVKCGVVEQNERGGWVRLGAAAFRLPRDELERAFYLVAFGPRWAVVSG